MNGKRITISLALTLAAAFIYYVVSIETTIAIALPVAVHELTHIIALRFFGLKVKSVRAELTRSAYCGGLRGPGGRLHIRLCRVAHCA